MLLWVLSGVILFWFALGALGLWNIRGATVLRPGEPAPLAARTASGGWLLATDADVVFHPALLRLGISCALERRVELLSLAPDVELGSLWERVVLPAFSLLIAVLFPLRLVNDPKSRYATGVGAFILMRRAELEALGGYERLKSTVIEDLRIAQLFKRNGRRIHLGMTRGLFRTRMYKGLRELWEGLSRAAFEGAGFSVARVLACVTVGTVAVVLPWVATLARLLRGMSPRHDPALLLALAACVISLLVYLPVPLFFRLSPLYALALPLAALFYSLLALDSMLVSIAGRGVRWKGRRYRPPA
jgi:hypothetical protein